MGAADFAYQLSENLSCLAVMSNFCKLLVDPAKPLTDENLVRHHYQYAMDDIKKLKLKVSFNSHGYRLYERLDNYYLEYHKILKEALDFLEPECIVNIHSHDPDEISDTYKNNSDVILYSIKPKGSEVSNSTINEVVA